MDLTLFEPVTLPLRVLDFAEQPLKSVQAQIRVVLPNGRKLGLDTPSALDEAGRTRLVLHYPVAELTYEASAERGGPTAATGPHAGAPGTVLPEATLVLPRTCALVARLLDRSRRPHAERWARLRVVHEDGPSQDLTSRTDADGRLNVTGCVKAAVFVVELRASDSRVLWTSRQIDGSVGTAIDLGDIALDWKED